MEKQFIKANDLLRDSFKLAVKIHESGFKPDFLVGLWRGGSAVGIAVQEGLDYFGTRTDHIAIRTSSYAGPAEYSKMVRKAETIRVHGLKYLLENLSSHHSLLIVDDVYSTGSNIDGVIKQLSNKARRNLPKNIRVAAVWYRPTEKTMRTPDFFIHETKKWLVLPYELSSFSIDQLVENRPEMSSLIDRLEPHVNKK